MNSQQPSVHTLPNNDFDLRRAACVAQGGHVFQFERPPTGSTKSYADWSCVHCGTLKGVIWGETHNCQTCEPYTYLDTGSRFGRRT